MTDNILLKCNNVCRDFGKFRALDNVNFAVNKGMLCGLIGPNGSGKTTFFNVLSGVHPATAGQVYYKGQNITSWTPDMICNTGISRTFQIPRPFKNMTVAENIMVGTLFGTPGRKVSETQVMKASREWMDFVGLQVHPETIPAEMTAGNLRKLEMARCLSTRPEIFLADEIMSGLNQEEIGQTCEVLKRINSELGITVIWIEHIMGVLMKVVERVTVLDYGVVICEGTPEMVSSDKKVCEAYLGTDED